MGAGVKLAESVIKKPDTAGGKQSCSGAGGGGTLRI